MRIDELISQTDTDNLSANSYEIIDQVEVQGYNVALTKMPDYLAEILGASYQLGFSKEGTDFTDYGQHDKKYTNKGEKFPIADVQRTSYGKIREWVQEYGPLVIASSNPRKTKIYSHMFKKAKFNVEKYSAMGNEWLVIQ